MLRGTTSGGRKYCGGVLREEASRSLRGGRSHGVERFWEKARQVAADEVAHGDSRQIEQEAVDVAEEEIGGAGEDVERVGHAVGKAAENEERHAEEQWQEVVAIAEGDGHGHDDAAGDREQTAIENAVGQTFLDDVLGSFVDGHGRGSREQCDEQAADGVVEENGGQLSALVAMNETGTAGVEFEPIAHDAEQAECKKNCAGHTTHRQISETGQTDGSTCRHRHTEKIEMCLHRARWKF